MLEGRSLQHCRPRRSKVSKAKVGLARAFLNLVFQGRVKTAVQVLLN